MRIGLSPCLLSQGWPFGFCLLMLGLRLSGADFQGSTHLLDFDFPPIRYSSSASSTAIDSLNQDLVNGRATLHRSESRGYLDAVLESLDISPSSQVLVYAKSSAQRSFIGPRTPRAIYFNDELYVGYIPGAPLLELTASDPRLGTVFYTLDQEADRDVSFERTNQCLECHAASRTMGVPGHLFRSFAVDGAGWVDFTRLGGQMTHRMPFEARFGGWYVSSAAGENAFHGRLLVPGESTPFREQSYPDARSDRVALMVLAHQVHFHNYLTRLNFEARIAVEQYGHIRYLKQKIFGFIRYLFFVDEAPLANEIGERSEFIKTFSARARRDDSGRSLRDFDLKTRLFKYRCSYLVGSAAFDALEPMVYREVARQIQEILEAEEPSTPFDRLAREERAVIRTILLQTRSSLTRDW